MDAYALVLTAEPRFNPGAIVLTAVVDAWLAQSESHRDFAIGCLFRHCQCDWGDLDSHDLAANDHALSNQEGRLLSAYTIPAALARNATDAHMWIITDDTAHGPTTILFPSRLLTDPITNQRTRHLPGRSLPAVGTLPPGGRGTCGGLRRRRSSPHARKLARPWCLSS